MGSCFLFSLSSISLSLSSLRASCPLIHLGRHCLGHPAPHCPEATLGYFSCEMTLSVSFLSAGEALSPLQKLASDFSFSAESSSRWPCGLTGPEVLIQGRCVQPESVEKGLSRAGGVLVPQKDICIAAVWFLLCGDLDFPSLPFLLAARERSLSLARFFLKYFSGGLQVKGGERSSPGRRGRETPGKEKVRKDPETLSGPQ